MKEQERKVELGETLGKWLLSHKLIGTYGLFTIFRIFTFFRYFHNGLLVDDFLINFCNSLLDCWLLREEWKYKKQEKAVIEE